MSHHESSPSQPTSEVFLSGVGGPANSPSIDPLVDPTNIINNWQFKDDQLTVRPLGQYNHNEQAQQVINEIVIDEGKAPNTPMVHFVASAINTYRDSQLASPSLQQDQEELAELQADLTSGELGPKGMQRVEQQAAIIQKSIDSHADYSGTGVAHGILPEVSDEIASQERVALQAALEARIEADRFPWTMPNSDLPADVIQGMKDVYDGLTNPPEALPTDIFRVAPPKKKFEGHRYDPDDEALLEQAGVDPNSTGFKFSRADLQRAGVFFINRVGGGEQPLLGMPIPDPSSPNGVFNVQDRSFLTREEFERVYKYQQENGYSLKPGQNPADVQMDMIAFATIPDGRIPGTRKDFGSGGRENKYGLVRSPFVDLGFLVNEGIESTLYGGEKLGRRRMNTTTIHLANGHPDYPGVSEMFDEAVTSGDQKYLNVGEFVNNYYLSPTTERDAFFSMEHKIPTKREQAWVNQGEHWRDEKITV